MATSGDDKPTKSNAPTQNKVDNALNKKESGETGDVKNAEAQVEQRVDKENAQGFRGNEVDPTDNHAYTVDGVTSDEPTPETDEKLAAEVGSGRFRA